MEPGHLRSDPFGKLRETVLPRRGGPSSESDVITVDVADVIELGELAAPKGLGE